MKKIINILTLVLLAACSENPGSYSKSPIPEEVLPVASDIISVQRSKLLIMGVPVDVTLALIDDSTDEGISKASVGLLDFESGHYYYYFKKDKDGNFQLIQDVDSKLVEKIRNAKSSDEYLNPVEVIPANAFEFYQSKLTLDLDRCRNTEVWNQLMRIASASRNMVYLSATFLSVKWVIAWDLKERAFKGMVATDPDLVHSTRHAEIDGQAIVLTPIENVRDVNGQLLEDSVFIDFSYYSMTCDYAYDIHASIPKGKMYLPRFNQEFEKYQKIKFEGKNYMNFVSASGNIYDEMLTNITEDDFRYAKKSPLYKIIKSGVQ